MREKKSKNRKKNKKERQKTKGLIPNKSYSPSIRLKGTRQLWGRLI
jgi:hypothetical protein